MNSDQDPRLFILGGICGTVGTRCYVVAIAVPLCQTGTYIFAMAWPILSIVFVLVPQKAIDMGLCLRITAVATTLTSFDGIIEFVYFPHASYVFDNDASIRYI